MSFLSPTAGGGGQGGGPPPGRGGGRFASAILPVPEPGTLVLLGAGLMALAVLRRRERSAA